MIKSSMQNFKNMNHPKSGKNELSVAMAEFVLNIEALKTFSS